MEGYSAASSGSGGEDGGQKINTMPIQKENISFTYPENPCVRMISGALPFHLNFCVF